MFTLKLMHSDGHTAIACDSYRVITENGLVQILPFKNGNTTASMEEAITVENTVFVENANGKTVDRIYPTLACPKPVDGGPYRSAPQDTIFRR
jgi:hypothetical protein